MKVGGSSKCVDEQQCIISVDVSISLLLLHTQNSN